MINYDIVCSDFQEQNWKLISTSYRNLDTAIECVCPKGHNQSITYREWRKTKLCKECLREGGAFLQNKGRLLVPEKSSLFRILALDAATTTTGYAVYDEKSLVGYGHFTIKGDDTTERINQVKQWLVCAISEWRPDLICVEHIQLQSFNAYGKPAKDSYQVELYRVLANLQGVVADALFEKKVPLHLVYSQTWRSFCDVNGKNREEKKKSAQNQVLLWYNIEATQDEADAICLGKYFVYNWNNLNIQTKKWGEDI